jgi:FMN-dependent NADH-azoreductase
MAKMNKVVQQLLSQRKHAQQEIEKLDLAIRALSSLDGSSSAGLTVRRKPQFSAAARERIAAAQRKRWAKIRAAQKK